MSKASVRRERVKRKLGGRLSVPTLPKRVARLRDILADEDVSLRRVGEEIALDPPLAARLLRTVNSASYSLPNAIVSPQHAASVAGLRGIENLVLRAPVLAHPIPLGVHGFDVRDLWRHAILTAQICRELPDVLTAAHPFPVDNLYAFGLLHDIAHFVMFDGLGQPWVDVYERSLAEGTPIDQLEEEAFGFTHNELGAMLLKRWALPEEIIRAARFHHNESAIAEFDVGVALVLVASHVSEVVRGEDPEVLGEGIPQRTTRLLELDREMLVRLADFAQEALEAIVL